MLCEIPDSNGGMAKMSNANMPIVKQIGLDCGCVPHSTQYVQMICDVYILKLVPAIVIIVITCSWILRSKCGILAHTILCIVEILLHQSPMVDHVG